MNMIEPKQIFKNYLAFEKELIKLYDLSFDSFFPQLLTILKFKLDVNLNIIINQNNYYSSLDVYKTNKTLEIYKSENILLNKNFEIDESNFMVLKLDNYNAYLFFCFEHIDDIYLNIFDNIKNHINNIFNRENFKTNSAELDILYRAIVENSRDAVFIYDMDSNIILVNSMCEKIYGYTADEFISNKLLIQKMISDDYREKYNIFVSDLLNNKLPEGLSEWGVITKEGKKIYTENCFSLIKDKNNNSIGIQVLVRDITQEKLKEKERLEKNKILKVILDNIPALVWDIDSKGIFMNSFGSGLKTLGIKGNGFRGLSIYDIYPEYADIVMKAFTEGESRFLAKGTNGDTEWYFDNFVFKNDDALICFSLDITENMQIENLLKSSLKEKEILLKEIHHRVKNNMQVISSLLSLQATQIQDKKIKNLFNQSQNRIRSMALAHETLYQSETLSKIHFNKYLNELINFLSNSYGKKYIQFIIECDELNLDITTAIPTGLIINELISNSLKYAFPEYIDNSYIKVSLKETDNNMVLIIEDNGIGFPKELDFTDTDSLGLQLVNSLVSQLNGNILLDKQLDETHKGSRFTITF